MAVRAWSRRILVIIAGAGAAGLLGAGGCSFSPEFIANNVAERAGPVFFTFTNNTRFRASFSFGVYDDLDRTRGAVVIQQQRIEAQSTIAPVQIACRRNSVIGTTELIRRAIEADFEDDANFDADAFVAVVNFSSAPADSDAAALPTQGTAEGRNLLLGVDYACGDRLLITFEEDPDAVGGFRIDFAAVPNDDDDL